MVCFLSVHQVEEDPEVESVQLTCKIHWLLWRCRYLPQNPIVEWTDSQNKMVHVYQNGPDLPGEQHKWYRGRTEMKTDQVKTGDLSLTLKSPKTRDSDIYTCTVYDSKRTKMMKRKVQLTVKGQF